MCICACVYASVHKLLCLYACVCACVWGSGSQVRRSLNLALWWDIHNAWVVSGMGAALHKSRFSEFFSPGALFCSVLWVLFFYNRSTKGKKKKPTEREKCVRMPLWTKEPDSFSCFKGGKRVRNLPWHRSSQQPVFIPDSPCSIQIIWGEKLKSPPSQNDILHLHRMRTAWFNRTWFVASKA